MILHPARIFSHRLGAVVKSPIKPVYYVYMDEIYLLFQHEYSANFLFTLWKRVRKYNASCLGITQNVSDLLQSHTARAMLATGLTTILMEVRCLHPI